MSKFFILVASLMCIFTLAACSGRAAPPSDPTSICPFAPFDDACSGERFDATRISHCNSTGLAAISPQTRQPPATLAECTALAEANPCLANPFQEICEETPIFEDDIRNLRFGRLSLCSFGGGSGAPCAFINSCGDNGNPFDAECLKFDDFRGNRITRIRLCTASQGSVVSGCTALVGGQAGNQTVANCIADNPFHADCADPVFDEARLRRAVACDVASPAADLNCSNPIGAGIGTDDEGMQTDGTPTDGTQTIANCLTNPFHVDCQNLAFNTARAERMLACGDAASTEDCVLATTGATAANWLRSFSTPLDTEPDTTQKSDTELGPRNQFLQGSHLLGPTQRVERPVTATDPNPDPLSVQRGLDIGEAKRENGDEPDVQFLNLATARYGEPPEGSRLKPLLIVDEEGNSAGDASDGVAFFYGSVIPDTADKDRNGYAGILAGTDLGAPPIETAGQATWNGQITALGYFVARDFELDIDFAATSVTAFVQVRDNNTRHFLLNGTFDRTTGVITGTVELGNYAGNDRTATLPNNENRGSGMLTGLIGQESAVGVFIKNNGDDAGKSFNFAGGFVAAPAN